MKNKVRSRFYYAVLLNITLSIIKLGALKQLKTLYMIC